MALIEIKKTNIGEQVYHQMKNQILNGEWKPGDKIPSETQLMTLFGVSRGTVRQAVQKLGGEGLILTRHGEGSFVQTAGLDSFFQTTIPLFPIGEEEMAKIFEFRGMFESGVAAVAAQKATEEQIRRMESNYHRMTENLDSLNQFVQLDLEFHMMVSQCTQNTLTVQFYNSYEELLGPAIMNMTKVISGENAVKYHWLILEAIRDHDPMRARAVMQEHMEDNMERFKRMLEKTRSQGEMDRA